MEAKRLRSSGLEEPNYWFPAKRYGWGWGPPIAWQGWVVLVGWTGLTAFGALFFVPRHVPLLGLYLIAMAGILLAICFLKGERPRWHWGNTED